VKPLIFEYTESPNSKELDFSLIEYSEKKNLNVVKNTDVPAIVASHFDTHTFTRVIGETNDSDNDSRKNIINLLDTCIETKSDSETTQSDPSTRLKNLALLMDTQTLTESREVTDSDR